MSRTLVQLVQQACGELGLTQPATVIGNSDRIIVQMLALTQRLGLDMIREFEWRRNVRQYVFQTLDVTDTTGDIQEGSPFITNCDTSGVDSTALPTAIVTGDGIPPNTQYVSEDGSDTVTVDSAATADDTGVALKFWAQDYPLPSDFDRMIDETIWDRTNLWLNYGSLSSQQWQARMGSMVYTFRGVFRIMDNKIRLSPPPGTVTNIAMEYVSNLWVIATGSTSVTKASFSVDTDTCIYPDDLMISGLKYRFKQAKGLDYGPELAEYGEIMAIRKGQNVPLPTLSLSGPVVPLYPSTPTVAWGNWDL